MRPGLDQRVATSLGILAIVFWSSTVAFSRSLTEQLGVFTAACWIYLGSGALGFLYLVTRRETLRTLLRLPWWYWAGCGGFFVANIVCFHLAVGFAHGRQAVIEVGLINYLWVSLTLLLSVPVLGKRARIGLLPGMLMACTGIVVATLQAESFSWTLFREHAGSNAGSYALAFFDALAWGLYSNLSRRWAAHTNGAAIPVFLVAVGLIFLGLRGAVHEQTTWGGPVAVELAYMLVFPTVLAYLFWDTAMRKGAIVLVVSVSYLIPLMSTLINCAYLHIPLRPGLWLACALVIGGAIVCRYSVVDSVGVKPEA